MGFKASSAPFYGSPTREELNAIRDHMRAFTARLSKNTGKARKLLIDIGAVASPDNDDTK